MKTKRLVDIAIVLTLLTFLGVYLYRNYSTSSKKIKELTKITKANDPLKYKSQVPPAIINTAVTSSACTFFLKNTAESTLMDYANQFIDHRIDAILKTCSGAFPTNVQNKIDEAIKQCQGSTRENIKKECFAALIAAKTTSVGAIVRPDVDPKELSATLLVQLIADKFSKGEILENPEKSLALVDALLEKAPGYLGGYKLKLMILSIGNLTGKDEYYKTEYEDTLEMANRLDADDPETRELALAEKGDVFNQANDKAPKKDNSEFIEYLDAEAAKHPKEWIYDYYKANAIYQNGKGDYEKAVTIIENALKKAPNDYRLKQTLENLKSDDENKRKHPFIIAIGFNLDDL